MDTKKCKQKMEIVQLNVAGIKKSITRATLNKCPLFESVFQYYDDELPNEIFIDRDPELFDEIVMYLGL